MALLILDIAIAPRHRPEVRRVDGVLLYDLEGLERCGSDCCRSYAAARRDREDCGRRGAGLSRRMQAEAIVPTAVALRLRLDQICRQELESFIAERGPFTREQDQPLHAITSQVIHKIAGSLARELKDLPEKEEQEQMTKAVARLFHLESPKRRLPAPDRRRKTMSEANRPRSQSITELARAAGHGPARRPISWLHSAWCSVWLWDICFADRRRSPAPAAASRACSREANQTAVPKRKLPWHRLLRPSRGGKQESE